MVTTGGAISGYWAIGRLRIAARPAITMKIESTAAKIGRSMKKRENMWRLPYFCATTGAWPSALGIPLFAALPRRDNPGIAPPGAQLDRPVLGPAFGADHVDELALRAFEHRALRHEDRGRPLGTFQGHAHELAGMQEARGIGQLGARFAGARAARDAHVGEVGLAGFLVYAAVGELHRHLEAPVAGQHQASRVGLAGQPDALLVGDAEQNVDRVDLRYRR